MCHFINTAPKKNITNLKVNLRIICIATRHIFHQVSFFNRSRKPNHANTDHGNTNLGWWAGDKEARYTNRASLTFRILCALALCFAYGLAVILVIRTGGTTASPELCLSFFSYINEPSMRPQTGKEQVIKLVILAKSDIEFEFSVIFTL